MAVLVVLEPNSAEPTHRWFHWINTLTIMGLIGVGLVILYAKELVVSTEGKIWLKTIHVYIGYVFCLNLVWRIIWVYNGNQHARWKVILLTMIFSQSGSQGLVKLKLISLNIINHPQSGWLIGGAPQRG